MKNSDGANLLFTVASLQAAASEYREVGVEHLFVALCKLCELADSEFKPQAEAFRVNPEEALREIKEAGASLQKVGANLAETRRHIRKLLKKEPALRGHFEGHRSGECRKVCEIAGLRAKTLGADLVTPIHYLEAILLRGSPIIRLALGETDGRWTQLCEVCRIQTFSPGVREQAGEAAVVNDEEAEQQADDKRVDADPTTPFLNRFGRDLTALARAGELPPCIGRKDEMRTVAQILSRQTKNNPVLIGEPGVGKTCIVEGLAHRVVHPNAPEAVRDWRIVEMSMASLIAGCMLQGQLEERLESMILEVRSKPNLILFLDELHTVVGAGGGHGKGLDAGQVLKPALARGDLRLIGATTTAEYRKLIEPDAALERRFQTVWVEEPDKSEAIEILLGIRPRLEEHHGVKIGNNIIEKAVDWSLRYLPDHRLPDKALDLIDQTCASQVIKTLSPMEPIEEEAVSAETASIGIDEITEEDLAAVVSQRCRVPVGLVDAEEVERLVHMEEILSQRVFGQDEAVKQVADCIRTGRAGLRRSDRPVGVFLFLGSTGTGKTELAKGLSEFLFGNEQALIRIDMSEYGEKHNVARLIGAPPGYVGHEEEGQLTGKVRTRPYSVILFDEIEKAHSDVFDLFLQIFGDGSLTDSKGRRVSFTDAVIIMTSNLGSNSGDVRDKGNVGFLRPETMNDSFEDLKKRTLQEVKKSFKTELINRVDSQIVFRPLSMEVISRILDKLVVDLNERLEDKSISIELSKEAREYLLDEGFSSTFGARELERTFERRVATPMANGIVDGTIDSGRFVVCSVTGDEIVLD